MAICDRGVPSKTGLSAPGAKCVPRASELPVFSGMRHLVPICGAQQMTSGRRIQSEDYPELFPDAFPWGYAFFGFTDFSIKQQLRCRRTRLDQGYTVFSVAPAFVMPYMTGRVQDVDHALFLMRFHVPCWAIAHVFGREAMYWYRLEQSLGRFS